jgi:hypothetical protein
MANICGILPTWNNKKKAAVKNDEISKKYYQPAYEKNKFMPRAILVVAGKPLESCFF